MAGEKGLNKRNAMDIKRLASLIQRGTGRLLVIDSRTFSEYNASHVQGAVNVCCSKLVKRRLQQDKVSVTELLQPNGKVKVSKSCLTVDAISVQGCDTIYRGPYPQNTRPWGKFKSFWWFVVYSSDLGDAVSPFSCWLTYLYSTSGINILE